MIYNKDTDADKIKHVEAGGVVCANKDELLISTPLGSCIAVIAYDNTTKTGGIAHIMLPGKAFEKNIKNRNKYAQDAINYLIKSFEKLGVQKTNIEVCLVGGANVLKKEHDTLVKEITDSVLEILQEQNLKIKAKSLGGNKRRSAAINIKTSIVCYTIGNSTKKELWRFIAKLEPLSDLP